MRVRVEEHRHDRLAGEVDARGPGRHGAADLRDLRTAHDQRRVVEDAAVADDDASAFVGGDALGARVTGDPAKDAESDGSRRQSGYVHSMHWYLPGACRSG